MREVKEEANQNVMQKEDGDNSVVETYMRRRTRVVRRRRFPIIFHNEKHVYWH
jgi:hypothetical protein